MATIPNVQIDGYDFDDYVDINSITCTHGRATITEQPSPSTLSLIFYSLQTEFVPPINIGSNIIWAINNPTAALGKTQIFNGSLTDINIDLQWGDGNGFFRYQITAVGVMAKLNDVLVGGSGYAKQYDGTRIAAILSDCGVDTTDITTPGTYEIAVYSHTNGPTNALQLARDAANSAMGVLFEVPNSNGRITYQSYLDRPNNTEIVLTTADVLANSYTIGLSSNEVANKVTLTYGNAGASGTTYTDTVSTAIFGIREGVRNTTLHNSSDANTIAQTILASRANPEFDLKTITINLAVVSDALRNSLCLATIGTRIRIDNLPTNELESFAGFIEGYTWQCGRNMETITLTVSNYGTQYPYTLWDQLNGTDTWNTYALATTTWGDLT
jgi:hypothetical protein